MYLRERERARSRRRTRGWVHDEVVAMLRHESLLSIRLPTWQPTPRPYKNKHHTTHGHGGNHPHSPWPRLVHTEGMDLTSAFKMKLGSADEHKQASTSKQHEHRHSRKTGSRSALGRLAPWQQNPTATRDATSTTRTSTISTANATAAPSTLEIWPRQL